MKTPPKTKPSLSQRKPWLFLSMVAAGVVGIVALNIVPSTLRYLAARNALADMKAQVVEAGGVAIDEPRVIYGGFWWFQNLCVDTACPTFQQHFLVPLEIGKEEEFLRKELLASQGYEANPRYNECHIEKPGVLCLQFGYKGKVRIFLLLDPVAKHSERIPKQDVSPKVWRTLRVESSR